MKILNGKARELIIVLVLPLALGACAGIGGPVKAAAGGQGDSGTPARASFTRFPDLPMPADADLQMDKTLIFGANDTWIGRMVIYSSHNTNDMFDFYKREMTGFGWREITSIRSKTSTMTYIRGERVATIQIEGRTLRGAAVTITVSPRGAEKFPPPPAASPASAPAS